MKKLGAIDICGIDYEVEERTVEEDYHLKEAYGYTIHDQCLIVITANLPPTCFRNAILHEAQHGIWEHSGCRTVSDEETFIQIYTPNLIRALQSMKGWKLK